MRKASDFPSPFQLYCIVYLFTLDIKADKNECIQNGIKINSHMLKKCQKSRNNNLNKNLYNYN